MLFILFLYIDTIKINLAEAKLMAVKSNPVYKKEALSYTETKINLLKNLSSNVLSPTISANYSKIKELEDYSFSLSINQPVFNLATFSSILEGKFGKEAQGYLLKEAKNNLYYEVENYYLAALKAEKLVELRKEAIKRAKENLTLINKKVEIGKASKLDLLNAEVQLNRAKLDYSTAMNNYELTKRALLNTLGIYKDYEILLEPIEIEKEDNLLPMDSLINIGLKKRPLLNAYKEMKKENKLSFWSSIISFLPKISYNISYLYNTNEMPKNFNEIKNGAEKSSAWNVNIGINLFTYPVEIFKYKTLANKSELNLLNIMLSIVKEVKDAYLNLQKTKETIRLAKSMIDAANEAYKLAETQYELGIIPAYEFFRATTDKFDAEVAYISAIYDYRIAKTKLKFAVGEIE